MAVTAVALKLFTPSALSGDNNELQFSTFILYNVITIFNSFYASKISISTVNNSFNLRLGIEIFFTKEKQISQYMLNTICKSMILQ